MSYPWKISTFGQLTPESLYQIFKLRFDVFVLEQACLYPEFDNKDQKCIHVYAEDEEQNIIAYARIVPPNLSFNEVSIGRITVEPTCRKSGLGTKLVEKAIDIANEVYQYPAIQISAQAHLKNFYEQFGFSENSDVYDDCGILHIDMIRQEENSCK